MRAGQNPLNVPRWFAATVVIYTAAGVFAATFALAEAFNPGHGCYTGETLLGHLLELPLSVWLTGITAAALTATVVSGTVRGPSTWPVG